MDTHKSSAKDVFFHLLQTVTLYVSIVSFLVLLFQYVNAVFVDVLDYSLIGTYNSIRWSTSILLVMFPVFIIISWLIGKDYRSTPIKRDLSIRRALVYITLFASAITIIVALIILINNFLSGELSTRFLLKVISVVVVSVAVFGYYIWDLKRTNVKSKKPKLFAWIAGLVILASIVGGFFIVGTPGQQRTKRFDDQRSNDLQNIENQVVQYWISKRSLPASLSDIGGNYGLIPVDPETKASYSYKVNNTFSFELCANFKTVSDGIDQNYNRPYTPSSNAFNPWKHGIGKGCFTETIDPTMYPVSPVPLKY